jgi:DMSO/TMAO reductase YedYZ heme-binding membrane subunit
MGGIFTIGHVSVYALAFLPRIFNIYADADISLGLSLVVALILTALLVLLTATSLVFVRQRMLPTTWKRIQRLAYPFFVLIYVHLLLVLGQSMLAGNIYSIFSIAIYTILFAVYCILTVRRLQTERRILEQALP